MHDLKQLTKDAEFLLSEFHMPNEEPVHRLAAFARDLTDPTPLTVERLVERGYVHDAIRWPGRPDVPCLRRGKLYAYSTEHTDPRSWSWDHDDAGPSIWPAPRTLGELAMIEHLMEGR